MMKNAPEQLHQEFRELFDLADHVEENIWMLLERFNQRGKKLFDLPSHQRIFLFILTRSIKTYSSILHLCKQGYGQDVCNLLRTLLENLITVKYILHNADKSKELARRFVSYKWVIFRRQINEQEKFIHAMSPQERSEFLKKKDVIHTRVDEFRKEFHIQSDKALVTWSGRTVRDMAQLVDHALLEEYETTFRLCSRFSHPSILGDQEYIVQDDRHLVFSPLSSPIGIVPNLKNAIKYMLEFLTIIDTLYALDFQKILTDLKVTMDQIYNMEKYRKDSGPLERPPSESPSIKESIITFKTNLHSFPAS